jgi:dihydroorotate dehydrogenase electron transfer subunit
MSNMNNAKNDIKNPPTPILEQCKVVSNTQIACGIYCLQLHAPSAAAKVMQGQFAMYKIPQFEGHILRRPFSIAGCDKKSGTIDIIYQVAGEGTKHMLDLEVGAESDIIAPLGNAWGLTEALPKKALIIAGGVGLAATRILAKKLNENDVDITFVIGAQSKDKLFALDELNELSKEVHITTDDGSFGEAGFVDAFARELMQHHSYDRAYACGPYPMLKAVVEVFKKCEIEIPLEISLESRMACGVGACMGCAVKTIEGYKKVCKHGQIFDSKMIEW